MCAPRFQYMRRLDDGRKRDDFTREERIVLASLRRSSGRTCASCRWYRAKGKHRGCYPGGSYRKWLSPEEFASGCERFSAAKE